MVTTFEEEKTANQWIIDMNEQKKFLPFSDKSMSFFNVGTDLLVQVVSFDAQKGIETREIFCEQDLKEMLKELKKRKITFY